MSSPKSGIREAGHYPWSLVHQPGTSNSWACYLQRRLLVILKRIYFDSQFIRL